MKKFKRILSAVLAVGMLTLITPVSVFAEAIDINGGKEYVFEPLASGKFDELVYDFDEATGTLTLSSFYEEYGESEANGIPSDIARDDIKAIIIGDGVTSIGREAFKDCLALESITIEGATFFGSGTSIGWEAFSGCKALKSVNMGNNVTLIDYCAFYGCTSLESITIPESVTTITAGAFNNCSALKSVTILGSAFIGFAAFYGTSDGCTFIMPYNAPELDSSSNLGDNPIIKIPYGATGYDQGVWTRFADCIVAESSYDIRDGSIIIYSDGFSTDDGATKIPYTGDYLITGDGTPVENTITVESGTHNITISGVNISSYAIPFNIQSGAEVSLTLEETNKLFSNSVSNAALHVPDNAKLIITDASSGRLIAEGEFGGGIAELSGAAIGSGGYGTCGTIIIKGGIIEADRGYGAAIGGGEQGKCGTIKINGGKITANSFIAAGIGGDRYSSGGTIEISGGTVIATSGDAGIGGGALEAITISGGDVTATAESNGAGIGGGMSSTVRNITISGGTVAATSEGNGAGIGGGAGYYFLESAGGSGGTIAITGGTVTATAKNYGAGIGGGGGDGIRGGDGGNITITGGTVIAISENGAGIGSGGSTNGDIAESGTFSTDNGNAVIFASSENGACISDVSGKPDEWSGIIFDGADGEVYGDNIKPAKDFTIPSGYTLTIPKGATLDISDIEITNNGTIKTYCTDKNTYNGNVNISHGNIVNVPEAEPTCEEAGNEEYWECEDCHKPYGDENGTNPLDAVPEKEALGHDLGEWASDGDETHTRMCQREGCEYSETENHSFGDWEITLEPTETEKGLRKHSCETCGYEEEQEMDTLEHEHVYGDWVYDETGHWHECTSDICPDVESSKIDYTEHDFGDWEITLEPTETEKGLRKHSCETCGYEEEQEMDTLEHEHIYGDWVYDETGHWHECTSDICPDVEGSKTDYAPHEWDDDADTECNICGYTRTVETKPEETEPEEPEPEETEPEEPEPEETEPPMSFRPVETEPKLGAYIIIETKPPVTSDIALGAGVEDEAQTKNSVGIIAAVSAALTALSAAFALKKKKEN